ncbi:MAG: hypothetical protein V4591_02100 [Bdellovibrionota bacterium]
MNFDSTKQIIQAATYKLNINNSHLAGILGVSERTLFDWIQKPVEEIPPKGKRLIRLMEVIEYIGKYYPNQSSANRMMSILQDGRVPMGGADEETNSMALISYVAAFPEERGWVANVAAAIKDYISEENGDARAAV